MNRPTRLAAVAALAATALAPTTADARASAYVEMNVSFGGGSAVVSVTAGATGALGPYVVNYYVDGVIVGSVTTPVADRGTGVMLTGTTYTNSRAYAAPAGSTALLTYGAQVVAPSGVPAAYCASTVWRQPSGATLTTGTC